MKTILHRGKKIADGEWLTGNVIIEPSGAAWITIAVPKDEGGSVLKWFLVYDNTVGQYTGIEDVNGDKIFEGDILESRSIGHTRFVVLFDERDASFKKYLVNRPKAMIDKRRVKPSDFYEINNLLQKDTSAVLEIIGSIHETPELLEVTE